MMRIVLLGAPGSGKGTQAQRLQAKYGVPQVSSGDLLRDAVARGTELGRKAKAVMDAGRLVSDDIVLGLIRERLKRPDAAQGFILDGFPRNLEQADALDALLEELGQPLDAILLLDVPRQTLVQRLAGRRICPQCGTVYNIHSLPEGATACARDGAVLYQRPDDKEEVIGKRLEVYEEQTRPLVERYSQQGLLRAVAGTGTLEEVFERMEAAALAKQVPEIAVQVTRRAAGGRQRRRQPAGKAPVKAARRPAKKPTRKTKARSKTAGKQAARAKVAQAKKRGATRRPAARKAKRSTAAAPARRARLATKARRKPAAKARRKK